MVREIACAMLMGAVLAGAAAGQQSVGVSAVILERVEADIVDVEVRSQGGQLRVEQQPESPLRHEGTRLLRTTWVSAGTPLDPAEAEVAVRVGEGGTLRLERRGVQWERSSGEVRAGESLLIDVTEQLTLTRVVASNS